MVWLARHPRDDRLGAGNPKDPVARNSNLLGRQVYWKSLTVVHINFANGNQPGAGGPIRKTSVLKIVDGCTHKFRKIFANGNQPGAGGPITKGNVRPFWSWYLPFLSP